MSSGQEIVKVGMDPGAMSAELLSSATLVVVSGNGAGRVFPLFSKEIVIGRSANAQVNLDDKSISTRHAKVVADGDRHMLLDLGSTNGTFLNGQRLATRQPVELNPGDSVQIAEIVLAYLPSNASDPHEQTQYLSRLLPQLPGTSALALPPGAQGLPDVQILAQLLRATTTPEEPPAPTFEERLASLMRIVAVVRRNWIPVFAAVALCAFVADASAFLRPPPSEASFKIRITPREDQQVDNDPENIQFYTVIEQNFMSPSLVEGSLMQVHGGKRPDPGYVGATIGSLKFEDVAHGTYVGSYRHPDPRFAVEVLTKHLQNYLTSEVRRTLHVSQAEAEFLAARVKEREAELKRTEEALKEFKDKHLEGLPEFTGGHITSRETLFARRAELGAAHSRTAAELALARKRLAEEAPILSKKVGSAAPYEQALSDVRRRLAEARSKGLGSEHPEIVGLKKQEADLQRLAEQARTTESTELERNANPEIMALRRRVGDLEVAAKGAEADLGAVGSQLKRLDAIVTAAPEVEARYAELTRSYTVNKEMHAQLFEQLRQSQLKLELERTSALARYEVLTPPESEGVPLRKALVKRTLLGIAGGLLLGALIAAILEMRRFMRSRPKLSKSTAIVPVRSARPNDF